MASNSKTRSIGININVNANTVILDSLTSKFESIAMASDNASMAIQGFVDSIAKIKAPESLNSVVDSLKKIKDVGSLPNVKQIAEGFERLAKIKKVPDLSKFVAELEKFKDIKLPSLDALTKGLTTLKSVDLGIIATKLRLVAKAMVPFASVSFAGVTGLAEALKSLERVRITNFIKGMKDLAALEIGVISDKLRILADSLKLFKDIKFPALTSFVKGLTDLSKLRITPIIDKIKRLVKAISGLSDTSYMKTFTKFATDLNNVGKSLDLVSPKADKTAQSFKALNIPIKKTTSAFSDLITMLKRYLTYRSIALVTQSISTAFWGAVDSIMAYSQGLQDLQAITTATDDQVTIMGEAIKQTASDTKFLATEVAEGMKILGQAGLSAAESSAVIGDVANLATGTLSSMTAAVDLTTTAMRVFNISASESGRIVDTFANAVNNSKLTIDKIGTSFNYIGPLARDVGLSFEETNAALASLANSGLRASTMGTGLRRILAELASPTDKFKDSAERAGVSLQNLDPKANSFSTVLKNLKDVLVDTDTAFQLFGKRGAAAALALSSSANSYDDMLEKISRSGTAASMAVTQMIGLEIAFKKVIGKAQLLAIAIGEAGLNKALLILAKSLQWVIDLMVSFASSGFGKFILQTTALTTALTALTLSFVLLKRVMTFVGVVSAVVQGQFFGISLGAKKAALSILKLRRSFLALQISMGWVAVIAIALIGLYYGYQKLVNGSKELARENRQLQNTYKELSEVIKTYRINISNMIEGSDEHLDSNLKLRDSLIKTADSYAELASEAMSVVNAIDPVTGEMINGTKSIVDYNKALKELEFQAFTNSIKQADEALKDSSGFFGTLVEDTYAFFDVITAPIGDMGGLADVSELIADMNDKIADGTATFEEFRYVASSIKFADTEASRKHLEKYSQTVQDSVRALEMLRLKSGEDYSPNLDPTEFEKLVKTYLNIDTDTLLFSTMDTLYSEVKDKTNKSMEEQVSIYNKGFNDIASILGGSAYGYEEVFVRLQEATDPSKIKIEEIAQKLSLLSKEFNNVNRQIDTYEGLEDPDLVASYSGVLKELYAEKEVYVAKMKELNKELARNPDAARANSLKIAKNEKDIALRLVQELADDNETSYEDLGKKQIAIRDKYNNTLITLDRKYVEAMIDIEMKGFNERKRLNSIDSTSQKLKDSKALLNARKQDNALISISTGLAKAGLTVHSEKVRLTKDEIVSLKNKLDMDEASLASIGKQLDSVGKIKNKSDNYNKVLTQVNSTKLKLVSLDSKLLNLNAKLPQILDKISKEENKLAKAKDASGLASAKLLKYELQTANLRNDTSGQERFDRMNQESETYYANQIILLKKYYDDLAKEKELLEKKKSDNSTSLTPEQNAQLDLEITALETSLEKRNVLITSAKLAQAQNSQDIAKKEAMRVVEIEKNKWETMGGDAQKYFDALEYAVSSGAISHVQAVEAELDVVVTSWKKGTASIEEYRNAVNKVKEEGGKVSESMDKEANGGMWDNFVYGARQATEETQSVNMAMQEWAEQGLDSFASGTADAFTEFVSGTKSAKEAFSDFAKSFLKEMSNMIMKKLMLKAIDAGMSAAGIAVATGGQIYGKFEKGTQQFKVGGTVHGSSPTSTADNIPAWLTAGEFVQPVNAVRKYGSSFMESIRTLQFDPQNMKGYALGGLIGGLDMIPKFAVGGSVPSASPTTDVNVKTGDNNFTIANVIDKNLMNDYLDSVGGEKSMINFISNNQSVIKGILR